jgi:hypothetical protein
MVGTYAGALTRLDGNGPNDQASWHYSVLQDGTVVQHYSDTVQCWHTGTARNNDLIGIEHEGGYNPVDEPLTPAQLAASVSLVHALAAKHGFPLTLRVGLWEHNWTGYQTSCPSGRIPWAAYLATPPPPVQEDDEMKPFLALEIGSPNTWLIGFAKPILLGDANEVATMTALLGAADPRGLTKSTIDQMAT